MFNFILASLLIIQTDSDSYAERKSASEALIKLSTSYDVRSQLREAIKHPDSEEQRSRCSRLYRAIQGYRFRELSNRYIPGLPTITTYVPEGSHLEYSTYEEAFTANLCMGHVPYIEIHARVMTTQEYVDEALAKEKSLEDIVYDLEKKLTQGD